MKASISKTGHVTLVYPKSEVEDLRQIFLWASEATGGKIAWKSVENLAVQSYTVVADLSRTPEVEVPPKFFTKAEIAQGLGHLCVLGCGKRTRTLDRSLGHGTLAEVSVKGFNGHVSL